MQILQKMLSEMKSIKPHLCCTGKTHRKFYIFLQQVENCPTAWAQVIKRSYKGLAIFTQMTALCVDSYVPRESFISNSWHRVNFLAYLQRWLECPALNSDGKNIVWGSGYNARTGKLKKNIYIVWDLPDTVQCNKSPGAFLKFIKKLSLKVK